VHIGKTSVRGAINKIVGTKGAETSMETSMHRCFSNFKEEEGQKHDKGL